MHLMSRFPIHICGTVEVYNIPVDFETSIFNLLADIYYPIRRRCENRRAHLAPARGLGCRQHPTSRRFILLSAEFQDASNEPFVRIHRRYGRCGACSTRECGSAQCHQVRIFVEARAIRIRRCGEVVAFRHEVIRIKLRCRSYLISMWKLYFRFSYVSMKM